MQHTLFKNVLINWSIWVESSIVNKLTQTCMETPPNHHHLTQKWGVLTTLAHRARTISDAQSLPDELRRYLRGISLEIGYSTCDINCALIKSHNNKKPGE